MSLLKSYIKGFMQCNSDKLLIYIKIDIFPLSLYSLPFIFLPFPPSFLLFFFSFLFPSPIILP